MLVSVMQAASPLAPGDKYPQQQNQHPQNNPHHQHQSTNKRPSNNYYQHQLDDNSFEIDSGGQKTVIMTGNGFFMASSPGLMKSKSGSLPDRYNNSPRGGSTFRDTFVSSMSPPAVQTNSATSSPHHHQPTMSRNDTQSPKDSVKDNSVKKWTFGGLFKRKVKNNPTTNGSNSPSNPRVASASPMSGGSMSMSMSLSSPSPAPSTNNPTTLNGYHHQINPGGITKSTTSKYVNTPSQAKVKLSESDLSSDNDSEINENEATWTQSSTHQQQQPNSFKQNFLTRRLSRRKEKAAAKKKALESNQNGFLKVPLGASRSGQLTNGKRVGSSPDSLHNNGNNIFGSNTNGPWPSWEITKKVPQLQPANNYSSSGSLSLSLEGSSKGSRMAAKEAVKARAVARRESFFRDTSSEDDDEDGENVSRSSIQGSHSSLSSRNRRRPYVNGNNVTQQPPPPTQGQTFRPADFQRGSPSSPANYQQQQRQSPSLNRKPIAPGSPRWEARVVYHQENVENQTPFVVRLPKENRNLNQEEQIQKVITAGLRVPISSAVVQPTSQYITEEVTYANLPNGLNNTNNMRTRSVTPQQNYNYQQGYNPSPPPPPPRRDFNRLQSQNHPNFYRPVSCSYLDSYQGGFFQQQQRNSASPNLNGNPNRSYTPIQSQTQQPYNNNDQDQVDNSSRNLSTNNNFLLPNKFPAKHANLIRSPSEPPEIKVQYARESPIKRNAITPSPASNYSNSNSEASVNLNRRQQEQQPIVTSKLGFPIRRLQEASKIPGAQSPVHMRASEFWRKKEAEVTGNPVGPNPNQKRYINRIRSADSSPLPIHRMRNSPMIQNSNESISSLSSFSAEAASPHMFNNNNNNNNLRMNQKSILRGGVQMLAQSPGGSSSGQTPSHNNNSRQSPGNNSSNNNSQGQNNSGNNNNQGQNPGSNNSNQGNNPGRPPGDNNNRERTPSQSACERLKVRIPSAPTSSDTKEESQKIRSLVDLNNGKTPGRNLEDALNELEDMYKSLRLSDEDLLDRAERRDLPTPHQELRNAPLIPLPQAFRFEPLGSVESVATGSSSSGGGSGTNYSGGSSADRVRAPPLRRSARPDTVTDDMARRKIDNKETKPLDPRNVVSQTGSYMILSPAFSPPVSPCPPETLPLSISLGGREEPNLTLDDVTFRNYRKANSIKIIDPQPPFGIPLGPITAAPGSDYLHSKKSDRLRPLFRAVKNPDLINDDIAFRNLRKDLNPESNLSKDWTPRLFSPTSRDTMFNYSSNNVENKKLRAIRSLSANVTNFIPFTDYSFNSTEIGKWNSFTDLHQRHSSGGSPSSNLESPSSQKQRRASTYLQPSWVEQIEKVQTTSTETLTENRNSNNKFASSRNEPDRIEEHWERKVPSKTVQLTPDLYDPSKPRRPWTDIILESFEKEQQIENERIAQEIVEAEAAANARINASTSYNESSRPSNNLDITEEDDEVFLDAREDPQKSISPEIQMSVLLTASQDRLARSKISSTDSNTPETRSALANFELLTGQKNRRGSWVEPRTSSGYLSSSEILYEDDRRRKSWSDFPKDGSKFPPQSPTKVKLFTPLPPPRKIKQINLEAFNPESSDSQNKEKSQIPQKYRGEEELNELMDMLIREADTCGPVKVTSTSTQETSQERVISTGTTEKKSLPKTLKDSSEEPTSSRKTLQNVTIAPDIVSITRKPGFKHPKEDTDTSNTTTTIDELIDSINESLPELEASCSSHKSNDSSLSTTESIPSVPSPVPGSPTTISFPVRTKNTDEMFAKELEENKCQEGDQPEDNMSVNLRRRSEEKADEARPTPTLAKILPSDPLKDDDNNISSSRKSFSTSSSTNTCSNKNESAGHSGAGMISKKKSAGEDEIRKTNERNAQDCKKFMGYNNKESSSPANLPFLRTSASRSRSQSLIGSLSTSPTTGSEFGESKKEKDKSHKRKSHLNRSFTEEAVPENTSSLHLSPHVQYNSEQKSTELSSSDYTNSNPSTDPKIRKSSSNTIYKVPAIPSILTTNNPSPTTDKLIISSPKTKARSSSILNKVQTFEKTSPVVVVVKRDSFSDAEGVSFIKKLLHKESILAEEKASQIITTKPEPSGFMLKKSPSANSYWSKFSNSQPAFLKKYFDKPEKPKANDNELEIKNVRETVISTPLLPQETQNEEEEPVLGFSVAQKASFFMKLEHEQRFSKWRKNSLEGMTTPILIPSQNKISMMTTPEPIRSRAALRQLTQPVTTNEVQLAANIVQNMDEEILLNYESDSGAHDLEAGANVSSYTECDESLSIEEPSKLSLKDRVHMFDSVVSTTPQYYPIHHSSSAIISRSSNLLNNPDSYSINNQMNYNMPFSNSQKPDLNNSDSNFIRRRGSASDLELSSTPKYSPVVTPRNSKTKSMFVADNEMSEDGEVSSGGQEVAEIISRSYENSPVVRKKSWRTQKQEQTSFTKEIWRRCKVNDNWTAAQQQGSKKPDRNYRIPVNYNVANQAKYIQSKTDKPDPTVESPPATSNLLQILTVLSSSNDELSESKSKSKIERSVGNSSTGSSVSIAENCIINNSSSSLTYNNISQNHHHPNNSHVSVPHPDTESFQSFFGSRTSAFSQSTSFSSNNIPKNDDPHRFSEQSLVSVGMEMNGCQRQSDLLVMKKNLPLVRRKSSGKSRNPLKALAARMDFRNQWYTDASGSNPLPNVTKYEDELF